MIWDVSYDNSVVQIDLDNSVGAKEEWDVFKLHGL